MESILHLCTLCYVPRGSQVFHPISDPVNTTTHMCYWHHELVSMSGGSTATFESNSSFPLETKQWTKPMDKHSRCLPISPLSLQNWYAFLVTYTSKHANHIEEPASSAECNRQQRLYCCLVSLAICMFVNHYLICKQTGNWINVIAGICMAIPVNTSEQWRAVKNICEKQGHGCQWNAVFKPYTLTNKAMFWKCYMFEIHFTNLVFAE